MTDKHWKELESTTNACPRGKEVFCDGTPNPIKPGIPKKPACKYFVNGKCVLIETRRKKE